MWNDSGAQQHPGIPPVRPQRVLVYCHDSAGIGHLRRSQAICRHVGSRFPQASFLLATGTPYIFGFKNTPGLDYVKLPSLAKKQDGSYNSKYLGISLHQLLTCRRAMLLAIVQQFRPTVLLVDKAPIGV